MRRKTKEPFGSNTKTTSGLLVPAPKALRPEDVDFLLIAEDGREYHLQANKKTFQMWGLIDTKVEVTGTYDLHNPESHRLKVTTFRCVDYFFDDAPVTDIMEELDFDITNFDYAM